MELYKLASTVFLGLAIAAVLQGRLIPSGEDFTISARGRRFWTVVDVFAGAIVLVTIAAGELLALRVLTAAKGPDRADLIAHGRSEIKILLAFSAVYVILQSLGQRALGSSWKMDSGSAKVDGRRRTQFLIALLLGLLVGVGVILGVSVSAADPHIVKTKGALLFLPAALIFVPGVIGFVLLVKWSRDY